MMRRKKMLRINSLKTMMKISKSINLNKFNKGKNKKFKIKSMKQWRKFRSKFEKKLLVKNILKSQY